MIIINQIDINIKNVLLFKSYFYNKIYIKNKK